MKTKELSFEEAKQIFEKHLFGCDSQDIDCGLPGGQPLPVRRGTGLVGGDHRAPRTYFDDYYQMIAAHDREVHILKNALLDMVRVTIDCRSYGECQKKMVDDSSLECNGCEFDICSIARTALKKLNAPEVE